MTRLTHWVSRFAIAALPLAVCAQGSMSALNASFEDGYLEGYSAGYADAVQQLYETHLRSLYDEREALEQSGAPQEDVSNADAALVEALLAVQPQYQAMYFEAMSDLQAQNEAYWVALEAAIYAAAEAVDDTEVVYTYCGVPAYYAPYAGYFLANGAYVAYGSANYVYPTYPAMASVNIDDIVTNIEVNVNQHTAEQLQQQAQQLREQQLAQRDTGEMPLRQQFQESAMSQRIGEMAPTEPNLDDLRSRAQQRTQGTADGQRPNLTGTSQLPTGERHLDLSGLQGIGARSGAGAGQLSGNLPTAGSGIGSNLGGQHPTIGSGTRSGASSLGSHSGSARTGRSGGGGRRR